jgi:aminopeptidase N
VKTTRRKYFPLFLFTAWYCYLSFLSAQSVEISDVEKSVHVRQKSAPATLASPWFDVTYYNLDLNISVNPNYLSGAVTVTGICRQNNVSLLILDLANTLTIDSVRVNGKGSFFVQRASSFEISLDRSYNTGETVSALIYYKGTPVPTGFGSFIFTSHSTTPWIFSLSEPYGAIDWWPCKNSPSDKADSTDIIITCDSSFKVGSQGILVSTTDAGNGKRRSHWKSRYPIASYLISVALTNYEQFSFWYKYSAADSMEILNYILPEHAAAAKLKLAGVVDMLSYFSEIYGMYPFIKEKYGHAEYLGGGMEHQTMTSLGRFDEDIVAHELAHQWFGDMITCRSWSDLWLNEGFAEYSTGLYFEKRNGKEKYWNYMDPLLSSASSARGKLGVPDTTSPNTLFNFSMMYAKGACVLQMLRHVVGDSDFFRILYTYATDPSLKYSTAATQDFHTICETVTGTDLDYFFQQWVYGENVPTYDVAWRWREDGDSSKLIITIAQQAGRTTPSVFIMPLDIRITTAERDTTVTVMNNAQEQTYTLPLRSRPVLVQLDPEGWVLKKVINTNDNLPTECVLQQNYPNPFNAGTTIQYLLRTRSDVTLKIYDMLGRELETLVNTMQDAGIHEVRWIPKSIASGVYVYRLKAGDVRLQRKMIALK